MESIKDENSNNQQTEKKLIISNDNKNINKSKKDENENIEFINSFELSPFYQILINKLMPKNFKIESEEILIKTDEKKNKNFLHRKQRKTNSNNNNFNLLNNDLKKTSSNKFSETDNNNDNNILKHKRSRKKSGNLSKENSTNIIPNQKRLTREHKPKIIEDLGYIDKDVIKGKSNPLRRAVNKICERGIIKIKKIPSCGFFYNIGKSDEPSLSKIEKNIRDFKYQSTYEFIMDLRKLWNHLLKTYSDQKVIQEHIYELCKNSEELYCELESINIEKVELEEMSKKVDNLEKKLRELKGNSTQYNYGGNFNFKKNNSNERSMSLSEKTVIKNNIKLLTIEQKKGIANILRDTVDTENKKVLEFDIEKLSNKKLKQLDEYVKNCLKNNNLHQENLAPDVIKLKNELEIKKPEERRNSIDQGNNIFINKDMDIDSSSDSESDSIFDN